MPGDMSSLPCPHCHKPLEYIVCSWQVEEVYYLYPDGEYEQWGESCLIEGSRSSYTCPECDVELPREIVAAYEH